MPLRDKAAQLVFARIGSNMPPPVTVEEDEARMEDLLDRCPLGGLVLFNGSTDETPALLERLQARATYPLLIASDIERGLGQQVHGGTVFPHAMAYTALGSDAEQLTEQAARITAREALACGLHITFAPVADVNRNMSNPIIATRAYGVDPETVARLIRAYIRGCRAEGLFATAKHFPGHGNTHEDSHATTPAVDSSREELDRTDLAPFRAAIEERVDLVMSAHVVYPALDPARKPATFSRPILTGLLREEMGYEGVVITDSMLMGAVRGGKEAAAEQAAMLLSAGIDVILDHPDPEGIVDGIEHAVRTGALEVARLDRSVRRVFALKQRLQARFGPDFFTHPSKYVSRSGLGSAEHARLAESIARRAVSVMRTQDGLLPLDSARTSGEDLLVVLIKPFRTRLDPPEAPLAEVVRRTFPGAAYVEVGPEATEAELEHLHRRAQQATHVMVALVVKPAAWQTYGLLPLQHTFVKALVQSRPVVLASLGSPYILDEFPQAAAALCTYSDVPVSQQALVATLAGNSDGA